MNDQFYILYIAALLLTVLVSLAISVYAGIRYKTRGALTIAILSFLNTEIALAYLLVAVTVNSEVAFFWTKMRFLGLPFIPVFELLFVLRYSGRDKHLARYGWLLFIIPSFTPFVVWLRPYDGWFFAHWELISKGPISLEKLQFTGWFWVHFVYSYLIGIISLVLLVVHAVQSAPGYRKQTGILIMALMVAGVLFTLPLAFSSADIPNLTPIAFGESGVFLAWAIFRYNLFSLPTISYGTILGYLQDAILVTDKKNRLIELNPAAEAIIKQSRGQALGKPLQFFFPNLLDKFEGLALNETETDQLEFEIESGTQTYEVRLASLASINQARRRHYGSILIMRDITERKQAELAIRQREYQYRILARNLPDSAVLLFDRQMRCLVAEGPFLLRLGYTKTSLEGKLLPDVISPEKLTLFEPLYRSILSGKPTRYENDADNLVYVSEALPLIDEMENIIGAILVAREITQQKQVEHELMAAKEAAEAANVAKSRFLANMSHELRTPLNAILGFAELMVSDGEPDPEVYASYREWLGIILRNGEHLLALINDVLEISKIEAGKTQLTPKVFNLCEMLEILYQTFKLKAEAKNLRLELALSEQLPSYIYADDSKLRQILLNLLSNALKFTSQGFIRLSADRINDHRLVFSVQDSGSGISQEEKELLFQPFSQTQSGRQLQQGTGLGLSIVREFVHLMNGDIQFTSQPQQGTTFTFEVEIEAVKINQTPTSAD